MPVRQLWTRELLDAAIAMREQGISFKDIQTYLKRRGLEKSIGSIRYRTDPKHQKNCRAAAARGHKKRLRRAAAGGICI